jgi:hypothetical protein
LEEFIVYTLPSVNCTVPSELVPLPFVEMLEFFSKR